MSGGPVPVYKKYTTGSTGIWEKIRQFFQLVPNRSSGNPVVKYYRVPVPASQPTNHAYKDPKTIPAGDIIGNPYFKRDHRRNYPKVTAFNQAKVSGLLKLGSVANPRISIGEKGTKELEVYKDNGVLLSSTLTSLDPKIIEGEILGAEGEPVIAPNLNKFKWRLMKEPEHGMYTEEYPVRIFTEAKA